MHRRSAWVSAAVLLGLAGTSAATEDAWHASGFAEGAVEMHSIPVERIRPMRAGEHRQSVAIERVRPMRAADVLAAATLAAVTSDELGSGTPDEPTPTRKNPFPFDRSALVPTGSRGVEDRVQTARQPWQPSSRAAGLVPTPLPTGNTAAVVVNSAPSAQPAQQATTPLAVPTITPVIAISQNASTQAVTPAAQPIETGQPVHQAANQPANEVASQPVVAQAEPVQTPVVAEAAQAADSRPTETQLAAQPASNGSWASTNAAPSPSASNAAPAPAKKVDRAALAAMFPAPEGWYNSPRQRSAPSGWDLVPTPLPTAVANAPEKAPAPVKTSEAATPMAPMQPMTSRQRNAEPAQTEPAAEPTAGLSTPTAKPAAEPAMSLRSSVPTDADSVEAARNEAILTELRRKAITREVYEEALRRLAERREAGAEQPARALMAGDPLGVQIARDAGYID